MSPKLIKLYFTLLEKRLSNGLAAFAGTEDAGLAAAGVARTLGDGAVAGVLTKTGRVGDVIAAAAGGIEASSAS